MRNKLIYICSWSVLLLIATFPQLFQSGRFIGMFLDVPNQQFNAGKEVFLQPLLFSILLVGIDVVYLYLTEKCKGRELNLFWVLVTMLGFIGSLIASIFYSNGYLMAIGFYLAWLSLTGMKFAVTEKCELKLSKIHTITED